MPEPKSRDPLPADALFLTGGGEMARLIAAYDWSGSLGPLSSWPASLKTTVGLMLNSPVPLVLLWGEDGIMLYNDGYSGFAGNRHPQLLGSKVREGWPEVADWNDNVMKVGLAGGTLTYKDQELTLNRRGQFEKGWMDLNYSPVLGDDGKPAGVIAIVQETTERVHADRRLAAERERLEQMFQQAPSFMVMLEGPEHRVQYANPGYYKLVGQRELVGRRIAEALPEVVEQGFVALMDGVFKGGKAFAAFGQKVHLHREPGAPAQERYVDFVYQPLTDSTGAVTGIFTEGVDVTERVQAEMRREALVNLTESFRKANDRVDIAYAAAALLGELLNVSRVGYGTIDPVAETLRVGRDWTAPGVETLAGVTNLRDYGSFIDSLKANEFIAIPDVRDDARTVAAAAALEARSARAFVNVPVVEQGQLVAVLYVNSAEARDWTDEELAFIREVSERTRTTTERLRGEEALREAHATLEAKVEARTRELMQAEESLRQAQKMEAVGQLTGGIAHDFNNLLGAIGGSLEVLERRINENRTAGLDRFIGGARDAAKRAAALTQRLLAFSRRQTLDPRPTDVGRLISSMEDLIRRSVGPNIEVEVVHAGGLWATRVDPSQLENSLLNLCINARDAMAPDGGRLTIETANKWLDERAAKERDLAPGQYVSLCVTDTGTGMPPEVIARAFDPFFTTKPLGLGTGLGLSMVYGFARQSGGQIRIYSEIGKGTTLCLYLPRFAGVADSADDGRAAVVDYGDGETVLIIDDEPTIRMLVSEVLGDSGYTVLEAEDGPRGLKILESNARVDLLITDVGLPGGMNGRQVADAARVTRPELKVLFITGYAENAVVGNGHLGLGMEVITKPFEMAALSNKVRALLVR